MPKLRVLSGKDVINILQSFGFSVLYQKGSHMKLRKVVNGDKQTLTIPNHTELDKGMLIAIYRQALRYVPEAELRPHFYTE